MSSMAWRIWTVRLNRNHALGYSIHGLYNAQWYPGKIMQAECDIAAGDGNTIAIFSAPIPTGATITDILKLIIPAHSNQEIPATNCSCGIYATKHPILFLPQTSIPLIKIIGVVEIWGKIIVAENGYRAQYARLRAIVNATLKPIVTSNLDPLTIACDYQVPLLPSVEYARKEYFS
jgi:hypothetical protein